MYSMVTFKLVGGHPALDFVNTVGGRMRTDGHRFDVDREYLATPADLYEWSAVAGVITASEGRRLARAAEDHPAQAAALLERSLRLRESLYRLVVALIEGRKPDPSDLSVLSREVAVARSHERLQVGDGRLRLALESRDELDAPLWTVASAAAELLTSERLERVKRCPGESCGWLFVDESRNRSRQWCAMADCGNVAKVRRFRERQRRR